MPDRFFHQLAVAATAATSGGSTGRAPLPIVGSRRHGLIYEDMLAWAIGAAREIDLLARDITVTREGRTLGQADLLLRWEGTVYHLEVAIKFYLRRSAPGDLAGYIGTDLRDRMDRKLAHLLFHQRHILDGVAGRHALERRGVTPPARRCVSLRGCIFEPLDPENTGASGFPRYWWAPERLWRRVAGESEYRWRRVDRKLWFSPITDPETGWAPALDLVALMTDGRASVAVAGARPGEPEITRGIVVRNVF